jgi:chorismate mutase
LDKIRDTNSMIIRAIILSLVVATTTNAFAMKGWGPSLHTSTTASTTTSGNRGTGTHLFATIEDETSSLSSPKPTEDDKTQVKTADVLSLDSIRSTLIRQEETIIFAIIERAQYRSNSIVYDPSGFGNLGLPLGVDPACKFFQSDDQKLSFLEYMLIGTEVLHCGVRRYTSPEEHPFFPQCIPSSPNAALPQLEYPTDLLSPIGNASSVNFNPILLKKYVEWVVPSTTKEGDDEQHGSTVLADIAVLQALSKRVHYGKFVAESKYRSDPEGYQKLVDNNDADGVMELLTNSAVEERVLRRARLKASTYGREPLMTQLPDEKAVDCSDTTSFVAAAAASAVASAFEALGEDENRGRGGKVDPAAIEDIYRKFIIPLTKDVEVAYLFRRCGKEPPAEYAPDRMSKDFTNDE